MADAIENTARELVALPSSGVEGEDAFSRQTVTSLPSRYVKWHQSIVTHIPVSFLSNVFPETDAVWNIVRCLQTVPHLHAALIYEAVRRPTW